MTAEPSAPREPRRRWLQFSLRTLLVVMVVVACAAAWVGWRIKAAHEQQRAVERIERVGGTVFYDYQRQPGTGTGRQAAEFSHAQPPSSWQRKLFGDAFVDTVVAVDLEMASVTDDQLAHLSAFPELEYLSVKGSGVTDPGLRHLRCLSELRVLSLQEAQITDDGLPHLAALESLIGLGLIDCGGVSDEAIAALQAKLPNCFISR